MTDKALHMFLLRRCKRDNYLHIVCDSNFVDIMSNHTHTSD